jgi:hypothetical protein
MSLVVEKALNAVDEADAHAANKAALDGALLGKAKDEGKSVERKQDVAAKAKAMVHPARAKDAARKAASGKGKKPAKAKPAAAKARAAGNGAGPMKRVTDTWDSAKSGVEVVVGCTVKTPDVKTLLIVGRWSKRPKEGKPIPFVTGTTPDGTRKNVAAADCTVTKAPAAKK